MALARRAFVLGGHTTPFIGKHHPDFIWKGHADFGKRENATIEELITRSVRGALDATGTPASAVDKAWIGNFVGELFSNQGHLGAALVGADPGLLHKPAMRVEGACASGGLAFACAVESIQAGTDVALVAGVEVQTTASARTGGDYLARAAHYRRQRPIDDFTFPALFAWRNKHCREAGVASEEDLARTSVKAYANAHKNPLAHMRTVRMTLEQAATASEKNPHFLSNPELAPYLKVSDCSQVSDGGAALIVVSSNGLAKLGKQPSDAVEVLAIGEATGNLYEDGDPTRLETTEVAAARAFGAARLRPDQIGVAEVHDCFTITEILMLEALGFARRGQGAALAREGRTEIEGDIPVNTGGGLVGFGHPVGATGVKQVLEIYRQMKGRCGDYQIPGSAPYGLTANMGGNDKTAVVTLFGNLS
jgi:acetyl-CoA acyltransferase